MRTLVTLRYTNQLFILMIAGKGAHVESLEIEGFGVMVAASAWRTGLSDLEHALDYP
jgi:hypothetical protein